MASVVSMCHGPGVWMYVGLEIACAILVSLVSQDGVGGAFVYSCALYCCAEVCPKETMLVSS